MLGYAHPGTDLGTSRLTIDLSAIAANTSYFAGLTEAELMAVPKANGFGHESLPVARTALDHGATRLGVTSLNEAFELRDGGITAPILSWLNPVHSDWVRAITDQVEIAVPSLDHLTAICSAAHLTGRVAKVHLHVDVGMCRDGAPPEAWTRLAELASRAQQSTLIDVVGLMGHLGRPEHEGGDIQGRAAFEEASKAVAAAGLNPRRHLAATVATLTDPASHFDMVRIGAGLVGIAPHTEHQLRSAMTLTAPVIGVRRVRAGSLVGYGSTHQLCESRWLATIGIGYADGLPRCASEQAEVLIHGHRRRVCGFISMDQTVVDIGPGTQPCPNLNGTEAIVFGGHHPMAPTVAEWAEWAGTLPHEIVTRIGQRVERNIVAGD